jgi:hypothetical protein
VNSSGVFSIVTVRDEDVGHIHEGLKPFNCGWAPRNIATVVWLDPCRVFQVVTCIQRIEELNRFCLLCISHYVWFGWIYNTLEPCAYISLLTALNSTCRGTFSLYPVKQQHSKLRSGYSPIGLVLIYGYSPASRGQTFYDSPVMILFRFVAYLMGYVSSMLCILSKFEL